MADRLTPQQRVECWQLIAGTEAGRKALLDLFEEFGLSRGAFCRESARLTDYSLGRQSVVQWIDRYVKGD